MADHLIALFSLAWLLWIALVAVGLILERRSPAATLAWLLALLFMPYFGFLVYLLFGPQRLRRRRRRYSRARARLIQSTHHLPPGQAPPGFPDAGLERPLARLLERLGQGAPVPATGLTLLETGDDCFQALETAIAAQAREQLGLPALHIIRTAMEKRATFMCSPSLPRPAMHIAAGLLACGDYVQGSYPATLEGAVRNGLQAADACCAALS